MIYTVKVVADVQAPDAKSAELVVSAILNEGRAAVERTPDVVTVDCELLKYGAIIAEPRS